MAEPGAELRGWLLPDEAAVTPTTRAQLLALEAALSQVPGAVFGDSDLCPVTHHFADGLYVREMWLPQGTVLLGKRHRYEHPVLLVQGAVLLVTVAGGREHVTAPCVRIAPPGTQRAFYALEESIVVTVHVNADNTRDLAVLEARIIDPTSDQEATS